VDVEKHGPGSVAYVGYMHLASGKLPDQPGVDCAESQTAFFRLAAGARHIFKYPSYFSGAEICVYDKSCLAADKVGTPVLLESVAVG
jgi:hypothetical protein